MINILLNFSNFDESWAQESMQEILDPSLRVLILPLSYNEGWINDSEQWSHYYGRNRKYYKKITDPFLHYGFSEEQISWVNYFEDDAETANRKVNDSDILFFTGGFPDWMMQRLEDLDLIDTIQSFDGIVMGASAGALIQLDQYHLSPDRDYAFQYQNGMGLLHGFDMDVHYEESEDHIASIIRSLEDHGEPVLCVPDHAGAVIAGDTAELMGGAFFFTSDDLDDLYRLNETMQANQLIEP